MDIKTVADPNTLGTDIAILYVELRNEAKLLYRMIMTRNGDTFFTFMNCLENFYGLWLSTSHHLRNPREYDDFFDRMMLWENNIDDEDNFWEELVQKSLGTLKIIKTFFVQLKGAGIIDLNKVSELEATRR